MALLDRTSLRLAARFRVLSMEATDSVWRFLHGLGAHHWQDGWDEDPSRGMRRYRGLRCTVCDEPWEGW
jgi:hypothetical protein